MLLIIFRLSEYICDEIFLGLILIKSSQTTPTCTHSNFPSVSMSSEMLHATFSGLADALQMSFLPICSINTAGLKECMQLCRSWSRSKLSARPQLIPNHQISHWARLKSAGNNSLWSRSLSSREIKVCPIIKILVRISISGDAEDLAHTAPRILLHNMSGEY